MNDITERILQYNRDLLPGMVKIKYKLMTENIFRFYRGTCHIFYEDLARNNAILPSPPAWISGDLHLENFGSFRANNRLVHFDLNDFDEALLAPASWEVVRLVTSIFIAFQSLNIESKRAYKMAQLFLKTYSEVLSKGKAHYIESKTARGIVHTFLDNASNRRKKDLLRKRTSMTRDSLIIMKDNPKHFEIDKSLQRELYHHITDWIIYSHDGPYNYEVKDVVFRLAGTGSVGLRRYAFLLESTNDTGGKYLMVDMKEARPSALTPYVSIPQPQWESEAQRVAAIQQRMQNIPPALLSYSEFQGRSYLIQEMQPEKDSINFKLLRDQYRDMYQVIDDMAMLTASSQLRSSGRQGSANADELIALGLSDQWQEAILTYATEYTGIMRDYYTKYLHDHKNGILAK